MGPTHGVGRPPESEVHPARWHGWRRPGHPHMPLKRRTHMPMSARHSAVGDLAEWDTVLDPRIEAGGGAHPGAEPGFRSKDALSASIVIVRSLTAKRRQIGVPRRHMPYDTSLPRWRTSVSLAPDGWR